MNQQDYHFSVVSDYIHTVAKVSNNSSFYCLKTISCVNQHQLIRFELALRCRQDFLKRRYRLSSNLDLSNNLQWTVQRPANIIRIRTPYNNSKNLSTILKESEINGPNHSIFDILYLARISQCMLHVIIQGMGIDNYFYTTNNIFVNESQTMKQKYVDRFEINLASMCGLKILQNSIILDREEVKEVFYYLPPHLLLREHLRTTEGRTQYTNHQINQMIRIRAWAVNMLSIILQRRINYFHGSRALEIKIELRQLRDHYISLSNFFYQLISHSTFSEKIASAEKATRIPFKKLFNSILVEHQYLSYEDLRRQIFVLVEDQNNSVKETPPPLIQLLAKKIWNKYDAQQQQFFKQRLVPIESYNVFVLANLWTKIETYLNVAKKIPLRDCVESKKDLDELIIEIGRQFQVADYLFPNQTHEQSMVPTHRNQAIRSYAELSFN